MVIHEQEEEEELICDEDEKTGMREQRVLQTVSDSNESFSQGSVVFYQDNEEFDFKQWFKH